MSPLRKRIDSILPKGFLWKLTYLNSFILMSAVFISSWAVYKSACVLVANIGGLNQTKQQVFNATLFQQLWWIFIVFIVISGLLHFYSTRKLIKPIRSLIQAMKQMKKGQYPQLIEVSRQDEIGQLVKHYNELITQLSLNEQQRKKLITNLSHEVRTPISNINGYLLALAEGDITGDQKLFASLYQESKRLTQMLEQLEQLKEWDHLSLQEIVPFEKIEIDQLLKQCVALFEWELEKKGLIAQVAVEPYTLSVHVEGIQQVVSNLLDNAIRYYEGEGPLLIEGEKDEQFYRISIEGPSCHIPDEEKDKLFTRFYRPDSSRSRDTGGSGLGLAITKEIVDRHNGTINVKSIKNRNVFSVKLPISEHL